MGATKRVAEMFLQSLAQKSRTNFITVRFGNVLNSHGSVVPLFLEQIRSGGPITVTDSRVQRYFMSIPEAVNLILQAVIMGSSGDIYILEMGKLIRIEDLAREMIKQAGMKPGNDIKIVYTGLRPGEKIYEELVSQNEISLATSHPLVRRIIQKAKQNPAVLDSHIIDLEFMARRGDQKAIVQKLNEIIPEFTTTAMRTNEKRLRRTRPKPVASTKVLVAS
jgi:FlaA1/EpsC-like NDP-sugar epimerase